MGTVIQKQSAMSMVIEDSTSQAQLRVFEGNHLLQNIEIGDAVLVIGRPREYGAERYILPEIVKKIDAAWLRMRYKEIGVLGKINAHDAKVPNTDTSSREGVVVNNEEKNRLEAVNGEEIQESPTELICLYIKNNDRGEGVDIQAIVEARVVEGVEKLISMLLRNGDVFEIRPGRVKVLE